MSKDIRYEHDGHKLIKACEKGGADVRRGKGDHVVVRKDGQSQVIPDRELGHGLQSVIVKWMVKVGIIATVLMVVVIYLF